MTTGEIESEEKEERWKHKKSVQEFMRSCHREDTWISSTQC